MIIGLLILIFFAIIFPGFFRVLFLGLIILAAVAHFSRGIDVDIIVPFIIIASALAIGYKFFSLATKGLKPNQKDEPSLLSMPRVSPKDQRFPELMTENGKAQFEFQKRKALSIRSPGYIWRTTGDSDVCLICSGHNGKFFRWNAPPDCGHPGAHSLCPQGYCRCWAEPIVPD